MEFSFKGGEELKGRGGGFVFQEQLGFVFNGGGGGGELLVC